MPLLRRMGCMKTILQRLVLATLFGISATSCTTAYDAYGRPQQVVDPAAAVVGAAAVGLLAYGLANNNDHHRYYRNDHYSGYGHYYRPSYRPSYGYSGYGRGSCY